MTIRLSAVADAEHAAVSGTLDFGAGLIPVIEADGSSVTWRGSLQFRRIETSLREELTVTATSADDLGRSLRVPGAGDMQTRAVALQLPSLTRVVDWQTARASVTDSLRITSEQRGGRLEIGFEPQLSSPLNACADSGSVRISGASNSRIVLWPEASSEPTDARWRRARSCTHG